MIGYHIGICVVNELDGSQEEMEIVVKADTDPEAKTAFEIWKTKNSKNISKCANHR